MTTLDELMAQDNLRTGRFNRVPVGDVRAGKLKADAHESVASVHETHAMNISKAMNGIRALGGTVTGVKHTDYDNLKMLKKRGIATGDMAKSTVHFTSGKKKFKIHVRTAHKLGLEGAEHKKAFQLDNDEDEASKSDKE